MKKPDFKIKAVFSLCLLLAGSLCSDTCVMGKVAATRESAGESGMVYVAGNPDLYPLEYYDQKDRCYKGVMPALLEEMSHEMGTDFVYVSAGTIDQRERLAKNRQVEVVSGCILGEELAEYTAAGVPLFPISVDGGTYEAGFAYTELASGELQEKMEQYLSGKSSQELMNLLVSETAAGQNRGMSLGVKLALGFEVLLLAVAVLVLRRRTKKREEKAEITKMVDPVTGVGNKSYFVHQFSSFLSENTRSLYYVMYLCFDIGHVNSYYGEAEAENILLYAADILSSHVKDSDFFARVTGGGFAVACQAAGREKMEEWAALVLKKVNEYSDKFHKDYRPEFCAGIYQLRSDDVSYETVLYAAQQGYQEALRNGQLYVFSDEKLLHTAKERQELCREFVEAIAGHQFQCYLQFMTDAKTGRFMGAEVLSRWQHPQKGLFMPERYIGEMEKNKTIIELDFYVFEEICRLLQRFREDGMEHLILFCNFSRRTISLSDFADKISTIVQRYSFDHHRLCIEITEKSIADNDKAAADNIQKCKKMGFMIAIDDVGSGYSSFHDLIQYPIDLVKIDRELLLAASQEKGSLLLQGMNALFHSIGLRTLCEGIETQGQYDMVRDLGIDYMQGFYIQRALPVREAIRWFKEREDAEACIMKEAEAAEEPVGEDGNESSVLPVSADGGICEAGAAYSQPATGKLREKTKVLKAASGQDRSLSLRAKLALFFGSAFLAGAVLVLGRCRKRRGQCND